MGSVVVSNKLKWKKNFYHCKLIIRPNHPRAAPRNFA